ncbi:MAG: hypothetical protein IJV17_01660 [Prevotella sp.]|nr:hypothetical protein [Prevotella sp.]
MKEDWTDKLRQKLAGHEKTPPAGLWEDISQQMGFSTEPVRQSAVTRRWLWAVAATILLLVGFFALYPYHDSEQPLQVEVAHRQSVPQQQEETDPVVNEEPQQTPVVAQIRTTNPHHKTIQAEERQAEELQEAEQQVEEQQAKKQQEEESKSITQETVAQKKKTVIQMEEVTTTPSHKWSLGVNASSGLLAANVMSKTYTPNPSNDTWAGMILTNPGKHTEPAAQETEYISEHHLPIRFGLNLHYQLTPRLTFYSGINYTYLYSKFRGKSRQNDTYIQRLHYLGVPLGLSYRLWSASRFQVYVSGGAMLEKCTNAQPWQWSVNAAVGAEYHVTRLAGFYLEPSLGYYFNDGTSLQHYYKEHPLSPSLEFGVRLHLNHSHTPKGE